MTKRQVISTVIIAVAVCIGIAGVSLFVSSRHSVLSGKPARSSAATSTKPTKTTLECIDALPDSVKIGQKIMVAGYSDLLSEETRVLADQKIGGMIVMDAASAPQLGEFKKAMSVPPFIAVDQEGGTIQRYVVEGMLPGAEEMAHSFSTTQAYNQYLVDNKYLKHIGVTTNFSPVVDVISGTRNPLPGRLYSSDPSVVKSYASAAVRAAQDAGITPVIKHFPGLGSASGNTDYGSAVTDALPVLRTRDLLPYEKLASRHPDVMVSNAIVPELTNGQPAVWSVSAVKLLREMGYQQAVVYSDSLTARALPGSLAEAVVKAWQAGIDVALIVQTRQQTPQLEAYLETIIRNAREALDSGALNKKGFSASVARIFASKGVDACKL
jgi:beta-N-acetylhexosaminidase